MSNSVDTQKPSKANYKLKYKLLKRCVKEIVLVAWSTKQVLIV